MRRSARIAGAAAALVLATHPALPAQELVAVPDPVEPPENAIALGAGTFLGVGDTGIAFLHLAGAFEHRISPTAEAVGEIGVVVDEEDWFAVVAPALRVNLMPDLPATLYLRAGPAAFVSSGALFLAHVGAGLDLARASDGLRLEVRTYFRPADINLDVIEVMASWSFGLRE